MALATRGWQICGPVHRIKAETEADYSYSQKRGRMMALAHYPVSRSRDWDCACLPEVPLSQLQGFLQCIQPLKEVPATVNSEDAHSRRQAGLQNNTSWQTAHGRQSALVPFPDGELTQQLGSGSGGFYPKTGENTVSQKGLWQPQSKKKALLNIQQGSVHNQKKHTPIKGTGDNTSCGKMWKASIEKQPSHHKYWSLTIYTWSPLHEHNP